MTPQNEGEVATPETDESLFEKVRLADDHGAFEQLLARHRLQLLGYLRGFLGGDEHMAQDVFQETTLQLYVTRGQFTPGRPVQPWIYTLALHKAIDLIRRNGRRTALSLNDEFLSPTGEVAKISDYVTDKQLPVPDQAYMAECEALLMQAIGQLSDMFRQPYVLSRLEGKKYREIAEMCGISVGAVKSRIHTAELKLYDVLRSLRQPAA